MRELRLACAIVFLVTTCRISSPAQQGFSPAATELLQSAGAADSANRYGISIRLEETLLKIDSLNRVTARHHMIYRIDSPDAVDAWGTAGMQWSPWYQERPRIKARVVTPDGAEHLLDPKTLTDAPARDRRPEMYDDERVYSGPLPAVRVGAVVEEEITVEDTKPFFSAGLVRRFWFGRPLPVAKRRLVVEVPASLPLRYSIRSLPQLSVKKEERNRMIRYEFEQTSLPAAVSLQPNLPPDISPWPYIVISTAPSWQAIASQYSEMVEKQISIAADLKEIAARHAGADRAATIRNLIAFLHSEVRYTGVEFGEASLVPRRPAETIRTKYGDCKDKSALLVALLRTGGIDAKIALLATGPGLDVDEEHPGMGVFDHAIVYIPGTPEMWIDATDEFRTSGLPYMDQGRLALVASRESISLRRTPGARPEDNLLVEHRHFELPEFGAARITEISEPHGSAEAYYRDRFGSGESKELREQLERYVKSEYLADSLNRFEPGTGADLKTPFRMKLEMEKAKRGSVDLESAAVAVRFDTFFSRFPHYIEVMPETQGDAESAKNEARTADVIFEPFITEWNYRISAPPGFRIRSLPETREISIGPACMTQKFEVQKDGNVSAIIRLDSTRGRYTAAEALAAREAIHKIREADPLVINYEQTGAAQLASGNVKDALASYRALAAMHPEEALHRVQTANALLKAGLGEQSREEARAAVRLEPDSSLAHRNLAWVLQHDLVGRRFKKGSDLNGAVEAYRKASTIDPTDTGILADLAILLEHDAAGERYSSRAQLNEAIATYRKMETIDKSEGIRWADNILYDLIYSRQFKEAASMLGGLPQTENRLALAVAAIAAVDGPAAALQRSTGIVRDRKDRRPALRLAALILRNLRMYPASAELATAALEGEANAAQMLGELQAFRNAKPYSEVIKPDDPRSAVQRLYTFFLDPDRFDGDPLREFEYITANISSSQRAESLTRGGGMLRAGFERANMPAVVATDFTISSMKMTVEGDDGRGYRIRVQGLREEPETAFVARLEGKYRLMGLGKELAGVGVEILRQLEKGNLPVAKQWLDWAREQLEKPGGDDPFATPVLPRLWTRGDPPDRAKMRMAALSIIADTDFIAPYVSEVEQTLRRQPGDLKDPVRIMLLAAYRALERWTDRKDLSLQMLQEQPVSEYAFKALMDSAAKLKLWAVWDKAIELRLARLPDDHLALSSRAHRFDYEGRIAEGRATLKQLIDSGRATPEEMNEYGWDALFTDKVDEKDIEIVQRASAMTRNMSFAVIHTLACLYAEVGKTKEAYELLMHSIALSGIDEPDSAVWYGLARLAEQYGEHAAAISGYRRVGEREEERGLPISTKALARKRLQALEASADSPS